MKPILKMRSLALAVSAAAVLLLPGVALAFPPAPHHLLYGLIRDQYGTPLMTTQAVVILITPNGTQLQAPVVPGLTPGMNYGIEVPMDAGTTPDLYETNALLAASQFKLFVLSGQVTNVPIQMTGNYSRLGNPGEQTRMDLTLGVDSNGDGLPDAWEEAFLAAIGSSLTLADLTPNSVLANDGRTLYQEFLAGNYPFDPTDSLGLTLVDVNGGSPILQFTAITGRSYTVLGSTDLEQWTAMSFQVPAEGVNPPVHSFYFAPSVNSVQVQVIPPAGGPAPVFFKVNVQ